MDPVALLARNKTSILQELIALARDVNKARALVDQLEQTESAMVSVNPGRYAGYKKTRDALKALFDERKEPLSMDEIKDIIVNQGGFRRGDPPSLRGSRLVIQKSVKAHLPGRDGHHKMALKEINGLIGPASLPDDMFDGK